MKNQMEERINELERSLKCLKEMFDGTQAHRRPNENLEQAIRVLDMTVDEVQLDIQVIKLGMERLDYLETNIRLILDALNLEYDVAPRLVKKEGKK